MFKKLVKTAAVAATGYAIYKVVEANTQDDLDIRDINAEEIIELLNERGIKILLGNEQRVVHFISDDKEIAIKSKVNELGEVVLIEFFQSDSDSPTFDIVYSTPGYPVDDKAVTRFVRLLGSIGVSQRRFIKLIVEIIERPQLADLSI